MRFVGVFFGFCLVLLFLMGCCGVVFCHLLVVCG